MRASGARVLDPAERISEVLFGLIMVLTFTGSLSIADAGRDDVRLMLIGALGCNLAWGLIDAVLYLMGCLAERARDREFGRARLTSPDWRGAGAVFLLVFLATYPVAVPFLLVDSVATAMRLSNGVAVVMLFVTGFAYGRLVGHRPAAWGVSMVALGSVLVALTIALGG
jgi:hypothetical protein